MIFFSFVFSDIIPGIKALKAFDWLIQKLKDDKIIASATLTARCDIENSRPSESPGSKLAEYWRSNSKFYNKVYYHVPYP